MDIIVIMIIKVKEVIIMEVMDMNFIIMVASLVVMVFGFKFMLVVTYY